MYRTCFAAGLLVAATVLGGCERSSSRRAQVEGEAVAETFRERYAIPRAFPYEEPTSASRDAALGQLRQMHAAGAPHVDFGTISTGSDCVWMPAGPTNVNGRVTSIAIDPGGARIFVATVGGLWRSTNRGETWQRISDSMRPGVFGAVALHPDNPSWVYAGCGDPQYQVSALGGGPGIWRSKDQGDTWMKVSPSALGDAVVFRIVVTSGEAYAATSAGVWVGHDVGAGMDWSVLDGMDAPCSDIAVDSSNPQHVVYAGIYENEGTFHKSYGATVRRVWKHDAGGWTKISKGLAAGSGIIALAMAPSRHQTLYAKLERRSDGALLGVYRTDDGGAEWDRVPGSNSLDDSDDYTWYNCTKAVDPGNADVVYAGGMSLARSTDGGATWVSISPSPQPGWDVASASLHVDQHAIAFDPQDSRIVYAGNDGGVMRSTALPDVGAQVQNTWHWDNVSHGMTITEFYRVAAQSENAFVMAGGSQDNGSEITFGNRTWYAHPGSDGGYVAVDAVDRLGVYESFNGALRRLQNPIPRSGASNYSVAWQNFAQPHEPVATDRTVSGTAIALSWSGNNAPQLYLTADGKAWDRLMPADQKLPRYARPTALAVAPSSGFKTFYVGFRDADPEDDHALAPSVWAIHNKASTYTKPASFPELSPNAIAVDPSNENRAFVAVGGNSGADGGVLMTTDGGVTWSDISGTGTSGLPDTPMTGIAIDPGNANILYVSSNVGVFRGVLTPLSAVASWTPFDEGLPEGMDVNDIAVNESAKLLVIGTMGYGAYIRSIAGTPCPQFQVAVRDNVFDRGFGPTLVNEPNPEDAVDNGKGFFEANASAGAEVTWFASTDIRVHMAGTPGPVNDVPHPDHVAFETCAIPVSQCPPGTICDERPQANTEARVSVQVTNRGRIPLTNVHVMLLWASGFVPAPPLPATWGSTFPGGGGAGTLDPSTGWHFIDSKADGVQRIKSIGTIDPLVPGVATFTWSIPAGTASPYHFLALTDCAQDPLPAAARLKTSLVDIAPAYPQVALRSLNVMNLMPLMATPNTPLQAVEPLILKVPGGLQGVELTVTGLEATSGQIAAFAVPPNSGLTLLDASGDTTSILNPGQGPDFDLGLEAYAIGAGGTRISGFPTTAPTFPLQVGVLIPPGVEPRSHYLTLSVRRNGKLLGGVRWVLRPQPP